MPSASTLFSILCSMLLFASCANKNEDKKSQAVAGTEEGLALASKHCSSCHSFVAAETLDAATWRDHVLPNMAPMLGVRVLWGKEYVDEPNAKSAVTFKEWSKIVSYYSRNAPKQLPLPEPVLPKVDTALFQPILPPKKFTQPAWTVMTSFDTTGGNIYTSDGSTLAVYKWNNKLDLIDTVRTHSPAANVFFSSLGNSRKAVFTTMGTMQAAEITNGDILVFNADKRLNQAADTVATELPRPIQSVPADFNNDGRTDLLVCGFGRSTGALFLFTQDAQGNYSKKIISNLPGTTQALVEDFNGDGWMDAMVLFAHSQESIRLLINNKKGGFDEKILLSFPPVYGSTSFQLVDMNGDGLRDIIYTCGDNADLSQILKPFHGVYIYLNKGKDNYERSYFYHINGCTKAIAKDFDLDGDLDIATIAFYGDYKNNPAETFILLKQNGPLQFTPTSPTIQQYGRWLTMEAADYDRDGDEDIILGNFSENFFIDKNFNASWDLHIPFIVLKNKTR